MTWSTMSICLVTTRLDLQLQTFKNCKLHNKGMTSRCRSDGDGFGQEHQQSGLMAVMISPGMHMPWDTVHSMTA